MSYVRQATWLMQGPRGLGETVNVMFPQVVTDTPISTYGPTPDTGTPVNVLFPMLNSGGGGGSFNPFPFLDGSQDVAIVQAPGSSGQPCFQVGFPWFGSKTARGDCKPIFDLGPVVGVGVTALLVGMLFFKGARR